jgi:hypothetical protein
MRYPDPMSDIENWLLVNRMREVAGKIAAAADEDAAEAGWQEMERLLETVGAEEDEIIALPVLEQDLAQVHALLDGWESGRGALSDWDKAVLKRALKAYRKRLKLMRLDDESSASRNPLSRGEESTILGVRPPETYAPEIWEFLVLQGKLRDAGGGLLELATI